MHWNGHLRFKYFTAYKKINVLKVGTVKIVC